MFADILSNLLNGFVISLILFGIAWYPSVKFKNGALADIIWSFGFFILGVFYCFAEEGWLVRKFVLLSMISLWSLRLGIYLARRTIKHLDREDSRYKHLRESNNLPPALYFLWIFFCQALLQASLTIPFVVSAMDSYESLRIVELVAVGLFIPAFILEMTADKQLEEFKRKPENKGGICKVGLWRYSRHPNYFFEWLIWISFCLFSISSPGGVFSLYSPLVMLIMLHFVSGVGISEEVSLKSRGEAYRQYQKETSAFFPWFPKG